jgi:hypothetical protein
LADEIFGPAPLKEAGDGAQADKQQQQAAKGPQAAGPKQQAGQLANGRPAAAAAAAAAAEAPKPKGPRRKAFSLLDYMRVRDCVLFLREPAVWPVCMFFAWSGMCACWVCCSSSILQGYTGDGAHTVLHFTLCCVWCTPVCCRTEQQLLPRRQSSRRAAEQTGEQQQQRALGCVSVRRRQQRHAHRPVQRGRSSARWRQLGQTSAT